MIENYQISNTTDELSQKLNLETGRITWQELQRYFAKGFVINVNNDLDLVKVAVEFSSDNSNIVEQWTADKLITRANDRNAMQWHETNASFWAVVVSPWVLVQEILK
ncbi:MAG: DUF2288 domain-containing protein [Gammaproteobacteria bacterium]|nr:DUF2288 domain-containing protein [Gammaproteobacteria bacterium]